jgi:hypothetical protein
MMDNWCFVRVLKLQIILGGNLVKVMRITSASKTFLPVQEPQNSRSAVRFFATAEIKMFFVPAGFVNTLRPATASGD